MADAAVNRATNTGISNNFVLESIRETFNMSSLNMSSANYHDKTLAIVGKSPFT